jgi:hypothetical protein
VGVTAVSARRIVIELTESVFAEDPEVADALAQGRLYGRPAPLSRGGADETTSATPARTRRRAA